MLGIHEKGIDGGGGKLTVVSSVCKVDVYAAPQVIRRSKTSGADVFNRQSTAD
jgi:hypothetical protein